MAGALRAHGIGQGDAVAAYLYNCPEYFEVFFGALKIRAVPSNVNYRYGSDELRALLESAEAKALFFDSALRDQVRSATAHMTDLRLVIEIGNECIAPSVKGARPYEDLLIEAEPAPREERAESDAFLSYTGGTTGLRKGCTRSGNRAEP